LGQNSLVSAAEAFGLLIHLAPSNVEAYKLMAATLQRLGRQDEALIVWQAAQKIGDGQINQPHRS
jgi:Flp pilus assembly protein TadD